MSTTSTDTPPHVIYDGVEAAAWLVNRHDQAAHIVDRVDAWLPRDDGDTTRYPDVDSIAHGINAADQYGVEWQRYEQQHPAPSDERRYDEWERKGPTTDNHVALAYLPMSSGEKRTLRMLAVLSPLMRTGFHLDDTAGILLQCCAPSHYGAPAPHASFVEDWTRVIATAAVIR